VSYNLPIRVEQTEAYSEWINELKDRAGRSRILVRVDRLIHGNPGQHRDLTEGVSELKIDLGPGYRVYYTQRGTRILLLLAGGDKSTQQQDIDTAILLARNFQE
jgi:putative addiction module killer protein